MIDHDQITKSLIEMFFQEFMELFFPDHAALIDFSTVVFLKQEYFTEVTGGERKQLDVVAKAMYEQDGIERGERETLIRLIERKFGSLEKECQERILKEIDRERIGLLMAGAHETANGAEENSA